MKQIEMKVWWNGHYEEETRTFTRVSRWISVKYNYTPTPKNVLWDYVVDDNGYRPHERGFCPESGLFLDYFTYNGRKYAIDQFWMCGNPFHGIPAYEWTEDGEKHSLSGVDMDGDIYNPIYIELNNDGTGVRVYIQD